MTALGEIAGELAAVLGAVVHDVGEDEPSRRREPWVDMERLAQRVLVEGLHVAPQVSVLVEAERVDRGEIVEHEPVIPGVGVADVVADAELPPAPVDVDDVSERAEGALVIEARSPSEAILGSAAVVVSTRSFGQAWNRTRVSIVSTSTRAS